MEYMVLDMFTRVNLELTGTIRGNKKKGSLLHVLDKTSTAMGGRLLRKYVEEPLVNKAKIDEILKKYGLYEFKEYYPKQLSGGMRQRVALIRTLILNPDILLLDEPFSSLDYQSKIIVQEDIYKIIKESKKTTLIVTHDISEAIALADYVYVLSKRPSTIKAKHKINLNIDNKTPLKARNSVRFKEYFNILWEELNNG